MELQQRTSATGIASSGAASHQGHAESLVDAAWDEVLHRLRPSDLPNARLVCRSWRRDVSRCLRALTLVEPMPATLVAAAAAFPRLVSLTSICSGSSSSSDGSSCGGGSSSSSAPPLGGSPPSGGSSSRVPKSSPAALSSAPPTPEAPCLRTSSAAFPSVTSLVLEGYTFAAPFPTLPGKGRAISEAPAAASASDAIACTSSSSTTTSTSASASSGRQAAAAVHGPLQFLPARSSPAGTTAASAPLSGLGAGARWTSKGADAVACAAAAGDLRGGGDILGTAVAGPELVLGGCSGRLACLELQDCRLMGGLGVLQACSQLRSLRLLGCRALPAEPSPLACLAGLPRLSDLEIRVGARRRHPSGTAADAGEGGPVPGGAWAGGPAVVVHWAPVMPPQAAFGASGGPDLRGLSLLTSLRSLALEAAAERALEAVAEVSHLPMLENLELTATTGGAPGLFELDSLLCAVCPAPPPPLDDEGQPSNGAEGLFLARGQAFSGAHRRGVLGGLQRLRRLVCKGHTSVLDRHLALLALLPALDSLSLSLPPLCADQENVWDPHPNHPNHPWADGPVLASGMSRLLAGPSQPPQPSQPLQPPQPPLGTKLRNLALGNVAMTAEASRVLGRVHGLTTLDVSGVACIDDSFLLHLASLATLLQLSLSGCTLVSNIGLAHVAKTAPRLRYLDISCCNPHVTDLGLARLGAMRSLTHLAASCLDRVTDAGVAGLVQGQHQGAQPLPWPPSTAASRIERLDLSCCSRITGAALLSLAAHAPNLTRLNIDCCSQVGPASAVTALLAGCPALLELSAQHCRADVQHAAAALLPPPPPRHDGSGGPQRRRPLRSVGGVRPWWMTSAAAAAP